MKEIWIIGVGQFGLHAVQTLAQKHPQAHLVLVDPAEENLLRAEGPNRTLEIADGIIYTDNHLFGPEKGPEWIGPALPIHLAAEWCRMRQAIHTNRQIPP